MEKRVSKLSLSQRTDLAEKITARIAEKASADSDRRQLKAWFTTDDGVVVNDADLRSHVSDRLAASVIPRRFVHVDDLPRTSAGKIDRSATTKMSETKQDVAVKRIVAANPLLDSLREIWSEVLGTRDLSTDDNFFLVGGDSMALIKLVALCQEAGLTVTPAMVHEHPTIALLSAAVREDTAVASAALEAGDVAESDKSVAPAKKVVSEEYRRLVTGGNVKGPIRLSAYSDKPALFLLPPKGNKLDEFWQLVREMSEYTCFSPFIMEDNITKRRTVEELVPKFLAQIRSVQPIGPYRLLGFCDGAYVAWEIARLLTDRGEDVHFLGNIDTPNPDSLKPMPESVVQKLRRRVRSIKTKSVPAFTSRLLQITYDWIGRRIKQSISGERHLVRGGSRMSWLYRPKPYVGHVTLFRLPRTSAPAMITDAAYGWGELAKAGLDVVTIQGSRFTEDDYFLSGSNAAILAQQIESAIQLREAGIQHDVDQSKRQP